MSQIQPNRTQSVGGQAQPVPSEGRLTRVALVIEYGEGLEEGEYTTNLLPLIESLNALIRPQSVAITLVHAEFDWVSLHTDFADEAQAVGARLARRETGLREAHQAIRRALIDRGYTMRGELELSTAGEGSKTLLNQLIASEQELLILAQASASGGATKVSPFAITLATHTLASVLVLRKAVTAKPEQLKLWLGVDASEASLNLARKLGQYLTVTDEAAVTLFTVQSPVYQENALLAPFVNQSVLDEALLSNANMIFEMCQDILQTQGVTVAECRRLLGSPASELGAVAEAEEPDVIAVGSHNRKGMLAWLLGSVSSQLLHWDTHNLLIVR